MNDNLISALGFNEGRWKEDGPADVAEVVFLFVSLKSKNLKLPKANNKSQISQFYPFQKLFEECKQRKSLLLSS